MLAFGLQGDRMELILLLIGIVVFGIYWKLRDERERKAEIARRDFEEAMANKHRDERHEAGED